MHHILFFFKLYLTKYYESFIINSFILFILLILFIIYPNLNTIKKLSFVQKYFLSKKSFPKNWCEFCDSSRSLSFRKVFVIDGIFKRRNDYSSSKNLKQRKITFIQKIYLWPYFWFLLRMWVWTAFNYVKLLPN